VFFADETFFFGSSHDLAIHQQGGRRIMIQGAGQA
jgi:hypothetical protein